MEISTEYIFLTPNLCNEYICEKVPFWATFTMISKKLQKIEYHKYESYILSEDDSKKWTIRITFNNTIEYIEIKRKIESVYLEDFNVINELGKLCIKFLDKQCGDKYKSVNKSPRYFCEGILLNVPCTFRKLFNDCQPYIEWVNINKEKIKVQCQKSRSRSKSSPPESPIRRRFLSNRSTILTNDISVKNNFKKENSIFLSPTFLDENVD